MSLIYIALAIAVVLFFVRMIVYIVKWLIGLFSKKKSVAETTVSRNWYGICERCGKKSGLHRFEGNRYCAMCYAILKTEKTMAEKSEQNGGTDNG